MLATYDFVVRQFERHKKRNISRKGLFKMDYISMNGYKMDVFFCEFMLILLLNGVRIMFFDSSFNGIYIS